MRRSLLLFLLAAPALADAREEFLAAREKLELADYEQIDAADRDALFTALASYDHPDAVKAVSDVLALFGVHLDTIEAKLARNREKVRVFMDDTAMADQAIGIRNSYLRKIAKGEEAWGSGVKSLDKLVETMKAWRGEKTVSMAISLLPERETWRVRQVAALASPGWHKGLSNERISKKLFRMLKDLSRDDEPRVRQAVARALASFRRAEALPLLEDCLEDDDWRVRAAAIDAVRQNPSDETVDMVVKRLPKEKGRLEDDIVSLLQELSGKKYQFSEEWVGWWKGQGRRIPSKEATTDPNAETAETDAKKKPGHRFYGIRTRTRRVLYIIDMSGSMKKKVEELKRSGPITGKKETDTPVGGKTRWEVAANELKRALRNLQRKTEFSIIFFNNSVQPWKREMIEVSRSTRQEAFEFIDRVQPRGATYTLGALRAAFAMAGAEVEKGRTKSEGPKIDTIFLLSDGGPTDAKITGAQPMEPDPILEQVRQWNKEFGIVIHTVAVHTDEIGTYFLKQLAAQNGGHFVERK